jgi:hypothetical protein
MMPITLRTTILFALLLLSLSSTAQQKPASPFVTQDAPALVLEHVRLIDGTGSAPQEDMRIEIAGGKITAVDAASARHDILPNARVPGGLLIAGCDPTGYGGVVPGFGDRRNVELLVEAGFTPVQAIQIATLNGAKYMGKEAVIGSIVSGKAADLIVLGGNPADKIENVEKVELVFKDGVGYDPAALIQSVSGLVGLR